MVLKTKVWRPASLFLIVLSVISKSSVTCPFWFKPDILPDASENIKENPKLLSFSICVITLNLPLKLLYCLSRNRN